jgi:tetratricopeptide (TPR) repeat protein
MLYKSAILAILSLFIFQLTSCKEKGILPEPIIAEKNWKEELKEYENLLEKDPSFNNFQIGMLKIGQMIVDTSYEAHKKEILLKGIEWCEKYKNESYLPVYKKEFVKAFPEDPASEDFLLSLVSLYNEDTHELEVKILYDGILKRWPESKTARENWNRIKRSPDEFDYFLGTTGEKMFGSKEKFVIDSARVEQFISLSESYALAYPGDNRTKGILMTAAQTAQTAKRGARAIEFFDWVWRYYPDSEEAPLALFLKGFLYETDLNNKEFAIDTYKLFIKKYPDHPRKKEAEFLLQNIHTPDNELIKKLEN